MDYNETYLAVIKGTSWRIIVAIAAIYGWPLYAMDVKTAFLNGDLKETIYMRLLLGWKIGKGKIWRLMKTIYGLKQAPREWYLKLKAMLVNWGWRMLPYDSCVFVKDDVVVGVWVDDLLITAISTEAMKELKTRLKEAFKMKDDAEATLYLGVQVKQEYDGILLH